METSANLKKWLWNHDSDGRKIRNASLEKAEQMVADSAIDTKIKIGKIKSFDHFFILRFRCFTCDTWHFWGATKKYTMVVDFRSICPYGYKVSLNKKFDNVPRRDALGFAPKEIRHLIFQDEYQHSLNPFL